MWRLQQIFRFADTDLHGSHKLLQMQESSLNAAIKAAVPGLLTDGALSTTTASALIVASSSTGGGRSSSLNGTHKALAPADAFNVSVLFVPTLAFLERVKEIMPGGLIADDEVDASTGFGGFLDDFVLRTYLPQLEEKVAQVFQQSVGGLDAFQDDPNYKRFSTVPIARVSRKRTENWADLSLTLGDHAVRDQLDQLDLVVVLHAPLDALSPRELFAAHCRGHAPVLPVLPRAIPR